jgi:pyruvate-ferredoxin/flavodoxin oxidoreductase
MAEMELEGSHHLEHIQEALNYFDWTQFSDEEFLLCPPVVSVGGDGAMYDIGFQNLSRMMMTGMPIKVMVLDTQVYSNTGGQACTSGFVSQVSDMAPYGKAVKGKTEIRKEMGLIGMAHRTSYVLQGSISNVTHLLEGYIEGLNSRRPALFNIYAVCQPEHGVADDASEMQSKLAVESRAYPLMRYNPDEGETWREAMSLEGNPAIDEDWPVYKIDYKDEEGNKASMDMPMTFADFAMTEGRFRKHFRKAPRDSWNENMVPLAEFIDMDEDEQDGMFPYIWATDKKSQLIRVMVSRELVQSTVERRDYWRLLRSIAGIDKVVDPDQIANQIRTEMSQKLASSLMALASGGSLSGLGTAATDTPAAMGLAADMSRAAAATVDAQGFEPAWIESSECTACDECIDINPKIFAYDDKKRAYILDPKGGPFKDIVKAAEKCTVRIIHPGTPWNPNEKGLDKLSKRAEKFK